MIRVSSRAGLALVVAAALVARLAWWALHVSIIENECAAYARLGVQIPAGR